MRMIFGLLCCVLLGTSCQVPDLGIGGRPTEIAANILVVEPGSYSAISGTEFVDVVEESPASITISFRHVSGEDSCSSKMTLSQTTDSPWLMCWDEQNRWWVYVPDDDSPQVHRFGHTGNTMNDTTWDRVSPKLGVPSAFMERLPESVREAT